MTLAPRLARENALDYCAEAVRFLLTECERRYPKRVAEGKMTAEAAERGIAIMRAIDKQWRWVMNPTRPLAPAYDHETGDFGFHNYLLAAEMMTVTERARATATTYPGDLRKREMADVCEALAWFQQDVAGSARIVIATDGARRQRAKAA